MASHKSAEKCIRQTAKRTLINRGRISPARTLVKKFDTMGPTATKEQLQEAFVKAQSAMAGAVKHGLIHPNKLARKVSRMAKRLKALSEVAAS